MDATILSKCIRMEYGYLSITLHYLINCNSFTYTAKSVDSLICNNANNLNNILINLIRNCLPKCFKLFKMRKFFNSMRCNF